MKRIRSIALFKFLDENGYLYKGEKVLLLGKLEYRRVYKRNWVKQNRRIKKEIRLNMNQEDYDSLQVLCKKHKTTPTALARRLLRSYCNQVVLIPHKEDLQKVYRHLGLVINQLYQNTSAIELKSELEEIEALLKAYLNLETTPSYDS